MKSPLETSEGEHLAIPIDRGIDTSQFESQAPDQIGREFRPDTLDLDQLVEVLRRLLGEDPADNPTPPSVRADLRLVPTRGTHVVGLQ